MAKLNFKWRTALIIRELELEVDSLARGRPHRERLKELMAKKEMVRTLPAGGLSHIPHPPFCSFLSPLPFRFLHARIPRSMPERPA